MRSATDLGKSVEAGSWLQDLETLEATGRLTEDASEAKWCVDALQRMSDHEVSADVKERYESLIKAINERLMSTYPLLATRVPINQESIWEELKAAGYIRGSIQRDGEREQQSEEKKEEQLQQHDDDEMAETAGRLLERVADNTSEKFQNSQFLELMRRLRDREVRVEGDKVVETSTSSVPIHDSHSAGPGVNPDILNYSAQDFGMPIDSEQEVGSRHSSNEPRTDEISDQFSYYNTNAQYHR